MLATSTFFPWEVYLALLSEELEFLRTRCGTVLHTPPDLPLLFKDLDTIGLGKIRDFRDAFLHPAGEYVKNVRALASQPTVDLKVDYIQLRLDRCIDWIRRDLCLHARSLLAKLPSRQYAFVRQLAYSSREELDWHLANSVALEFMFSVAEAMHADSQSISNGALSGWKPSHHQIVVAAKLSQVLVSVVPFDPMLCDELSPMEAQPPLDDMIVAGVLGALPDGREPAELHDARACHVAKYKSGYWHLLYGSMVLVNEVLYLVRRKGGDEAVWSLWEEINGSALGRLAVASMAPVFKAYMLCRGGNPDLRVPWLEEVCANEDQSQSIVRLRNEVFHVDSPKIFPEPLMGKDNDHFHYRLALSLAEFLGRFTDLPPNASHRTDL